MEMESIIQQQVIDISSGPDGNADYFAQDAAFLEAAKARHTEMSAFMKALGISSMRTQIKNSAGETFKLMIKL